MQDLINWFKNADPDYAGTSDGVIVAMFIVAILIVLLAIFSGIVQIVLMIKYIKYNHTQNSLGMTGQDIARKCLDAEGLEHIKVKCTGSLIFGNSYSHYFKKVRLRRLTWKKTSISAMAMATQKSCLAVLDKEGDKDMKTRIILTPLIYLGPIAIIPLVLLGVIIDLLTSGMNFSFTVAFVLLAALLYVVSFVLSLMVLKTEVKAQKRALEVMEKDGIANAEEREMCKKLFKLYNIEYVNNIIMSLLELIYRVLQIVARAQSSSSRSSNN